MKFETAPAFEGDLRRLSRQERRRFREVAIGDFAPACDSVARGKGARWPSRLRVRPVEGCPGVFEMTWNFAGPDGRATWQWRRLASGEACIRWRRVGSHQIFRDP